MSRRSLVTALAALTVAAAVGATMLASVGPLAALLAAAMVVLGAVVGRFWIALVPPVLCAVLAACVVAGGAPADGEDWRGFIAMMLVTFGLAAAFCVTVGTVIRRVAASSAARALYE